MNPQIKPEIIAELRGRAVRRVPTAWDRLRKWWRRLWEPNT